MKIKEGYELTEIADTNMAIYIGDDGDGLKGVVNLNKSGVFMWKKLTGGCALDELIRAVTTEYDIDKTTAAKDIEVFLDSLRAENILVD